MSRVIQNSYVHNWYNNGGSALGDVASGDYVAIRAAQVNEAYKAFGMTDINKPGLANTGYPRVSGAYAVRLIDYWREQARRYSGITVNQVMITLFGSDAQFLSWLRKVNSLERDLGAQLRAKAIGMGNQLLSDSDTKALWDLIDPVVIGMGAIRDTPSQWEMLRQAVAESIEDLAKTAPFRGLNNLLTAAKWLGGGLIAYVVYDSLRRK